jgi:hypothetical protein
LTVFFDCFLVFPSARIASHVLMKFKNTEPSSPNVLKKNEEELALSLIYVIVICLFSLLLITEDSIQ